MNISATLYRLRTARGLSQEALAEAIDVSRQAVSKWETGAAVPDVDKIVQLSEFYGVTTDYILKGESAPRAEERGPDACSGPEEPAAEHVPEAEPAAAAAARDLSAPAVFTRLWPALCLGVSGVGAVAFCALWFMRGFWYMSTLDYLLLIAIAGTVAAALGALLFELGALAVPPLRTRRAFFYSYAVWAFALLPCCFVSGLIDFFFSNWLWWRLESALGSVAAVVIRIGFVYLLPFILYGGACTSLRDVMEERQSAQNDSKQP